MQRTSSGGSSSNLSGVGVQRGGQRYQGAAGKVDPRGGVNNYQNNRRK